MGAPAGQIPSIRAGDMVLPGYRDYGAVFAHCGAVIHHGGIGTAALALRAGVPALVVPWAFDQAFNGTQVERLGAGKLIPLSRFRPERGGRALQELLEQSEHRAAAAGIAHALGAEDGAAAIADRLEAWLTPTRSRLERPRTDPDVPLGTG
jgi:rhamnosyltransferase subunit B